MLKSFLAVCAALATGSAAAAAPYVNVENNAGWVGNDFQGSVTDFALGYEGNHGAYSWYVQGGPSLLSPKDSDITMEFSGKLGGSVKVTERIGIYAEASGMTGDGENSYGTKWGTTYTF